MSPRAWVFSDAPYAGGAERYLEWHLQAAGPERLGLVAVASEGLHAWLAAREAEGFQVDRITPGPLLARARAFQAWLGRRGPELVHVNMPGPYDGILTLAPVLARVAGVPRVVVTEHLPGVGRVGKRYWLKRAGIGAIHRAIAVCERHRDLMMDTFGYAPGQAVAVRNGVPDPNPQGEVAGALRRPLPPVWAARERHGGVRFMQVGSLDERKGVDVLLRAWALAEGWGLRGSLWLVGEGPQRGRLEALAVELGVADRVVFTGQVDDAARLWPHADVAVLASHREGLPLSLVEASAWGLPTVASAVDGVPEVVRARETGWLVEAGDVRQLAWALREAARDPACRARWGAAARTRYELLFGFQRMLRETFDQYGPVARGWTS